MAKTGNRRSTVVVGVMRNARRKLRIDDAVSEAAKNRLVRPRRRARHVGRGNIDPRSRRRR